MYNTPTFKQIDKNVYRIYDDDQDIGDVFRDKDGKWHLTISCMNYKDKDQYRNDLFERANHKYEKHMNKNFVWELFLVE